jgi:hypothetical protein
MTLPDVNVLVHGLRADMPNHAACRAWLDGQVNGMVAYGVSPLVLSGLIRVATNRRIFPDPTTPAEALAFCGRLLSQRHCVVVEPGPNHWATFTKLVRDLNLSGVDIPDAWFAALAIEQSCEWITYDRGFSRFPGLTWRTP